MTPSSRKSASLDLLASARRRTPKAERGVGSCGSAAAVVLAPDRPATDSFRRQTRLKTMKRSVLIVDDDSRIRTSLAEALSSSDTTVRTAVDADAAGVRTAATSCSRTRRRRPIAIPSGGFRWRGASPTAWSSRWATLRDSPA